jgi:hypothetical protein
MSYGQLNACRGNIDIHRKNFNQLLMGDNMVFKPKRSQSSQCTCIPSIGHEARNGKRQIASSCRVLQDIYRLWAK